MVSSDFSMNIPIKTTMNLQLHYTYSDQPSKMAVIEGTNTNYPNKSQLGRISYEFIKQNGKTVTKESIVTFSTIFMARQKHYKHYDQFNSKPRRRMPPRNSHWKEKKDMLSHKSCTATISTNSSSSDWYTYSKDRVISPWMCALSSTSMSRFRSSLSFSPSSSSLPFSDCLTVLSSLEIIVLLFVDCRPGW